MRRTTIYLPAGLKRRLEARAAAERESQSAVVRHALERFLAEPPRSQRLPLDGEVMGETDGRADPAADVRAEGSAET